MTRKANLNMTLPHPLAVSLYASGLANLATAAGALSVVFAIGVGGVWWWIAAAAAAAAVVLHTAARAFGALADRITAGPARWAGQIKIGPARVRCSGSYETPEWL